MNKETDKQLEDDFSSDEFDDLYTDDDETEMEMIEDDDLNTVDLDDVSFEEVDVNRESDLGFISEDIEEVYSSDEAIEEHHDEPMGQPAPERKKSSLGTMMVVLGVIAAGGAGAYFSGMIPGLSSNESSRAYQATQETDVVDNGLSQYSEEETGQADATAHGVQEENVPNSVSEDLGALYDEGNATEFEQYSQAKADAAAAEAAAMSAEQNTDFVDEFEQPEVINPDPVVSEPTIEENTADDSVNDVAFTEDPKPVVQGNTPVNTVDVGNLEGQLSGLNSRFDAMQRDLASRIEKMEGQVASGAIASSGSIDKSVSSDMAQIKSTLDDLVNRLDKMEQQVQKLSSAVPSKTPAPVAAPVKTEAPKISSSAAKEETKTPVKAKATSGTTASSWEIRAIQVGKAVIAKKGGSETRNISEGDSVPGLGTIREIAYKEGSGWVIQGSSGSIKQ